jgi:predicted phage-related endonuclease
MSMNVLSAKVRELKELKVMAEELAAEITAIEDDVKAHMTAQGVDEIAVDVFKVRYKAVTSNRFDTTAFKATHAELYGQYTKQTTTRRFSVA